MEASKKILKKDQRGKGCQGYRMAGPLQEPGRTELKNTRAGFIHQSGTPLAGLKRGRAKRKKGVDTRVNVRKEEGEPELRDRRPQQTSCLPPDL